MKDRWAKLPTERISAGLPQLDRLPVARAVAALVARERRTVAAVVRAEAAITRVAEAAAIALGAGGRILYAGAGTSGRLGVLDAAECPPTFGTSPRQVVGLIAGGRRALTRAIEGAEDDAPAGAAAVRAARVDEADLVIGIAASGATPYVRGALAAARAAGATTALVTCAGNEAWSAGLRPDHLIDLQVGPELLAGSTRLGAGTATKIALNTISTAAMVQLGRTWGPYMVDVVATNAKLRARARRILTLLTGVQGKAADALLARAGGRLKLALVMHGLGVDARTARRHLASSSGRLADVLGPAPVRAR
jgi:N-acetylmuramic acid 6-phosphate etherase